MARGRRRSRKRKGYVYLGRRIPDEGRPGLDTVKEYKGIMNAIVRDYRMGRISEAKARGRLLLLYRLTYVRHNSKARRLSPRTRERLRREIRKAMRNLSQYNSRGGIGAH